jgi:hypothetical protein
MNTQNVTAAKPKAAGAIHRAPVGSKLPITYSETLDPAFKNLGYVSEDGVTNGNSPSGDKVRAWGGTTVMNYMEDKPDTFKMNLIEAFNSEVLKTIYNDKNVTVEENGDIHVQSTAEDMTQYAWVIDMILKGNRAKRIVIPIASITEMEEIVYKDNEPVGYGITLSAEPDASGVYHHEYIQGAVPTTT